MLHYDFLPEDDNALPGYGPTDVRVAFVGGAPGLTRNHGDRNAPFGASSLSLIKKIQKVAGEDTYLTNLVKVPQSAKKKIPIKLVRSQYPALREELKMVGPKRILALGKEAAETLCPGFKNLREDHGTMFYNPELEAFVVPTFHFSSISSQAENLEAIVHDAERLFTLPDPKKPRYEYVETAKQLKSVMASFVGELLFCDIETTGLEFSDELIEIGFTDSKSDLVYIVREKLLRYFIVECKLQGFRLVGHNFQFDLSRMIYWAGEDEWYPDIYDTSITAHVLGERALSLKHLTAKYTTRPGSRSMGGPGDPAYVAEDVLSTRAIYDYQQEVMAGEPPWILDELNAKVATIGNQQRRGVFIDREQMKELGDELTKRVATALRKLRKAFPGDINWNAGAQIGQALQAAGVKLTEKTETGQWKTDEATLLDLVERGESSVKYILDYREAVKEQQFAVSYLELTTDEDPYLRPKLNITGTGTGRLSCRDPNLQQVPREGPLKLCFVSRWSIWTTKNGLRQYKIRGKIGLVDLSQAELRVVALLSGDEVLMEALLEGDVHLNIASLVFNKPPEEVTPLERKKSKGVTFGLLYGGSPAGLAHRIGVAVAEVERIVDMFFKVFKKLARWIKNETRKVTSTGLSTTLFGRVRDLNELILREGKKSAARKASNTPVQSIASDCDLIILGECDRWLRDNQCRTRTVLGVHDSIIFDIFPGEEDKLIQAATSGFLKLAETPLGELELWPKLPLVGELVFGNSWAEVESTNINYAPERKYPLSSLMEAA